MDKQEFINGIIKKVRNSSLNGTITNFTKPAGRAPRVKLKNISEWYNRLSENDKDMLFKALEEVVDETIFGFLCVLDGVRIISDKNEELVLTSLHGNDTEIINDSLNEPLHAIYNSLTQER